MSDLILSANSNSGSRKPFVPHPSGAYPAILADVYRRDKPNPYKGRPRDAKDPSRGIDTRETINVVRFVFLTGHLVEGKPAYVAKEFTPVLSESSNLRKFLSAWIPSLTAEDFERGVNLEALVGTPAYITVTNSPGRKDPNKVYDDIAAAMPIPPGVAVPAIPDTFIRHKDKGAVGSSTPAPAAAPNPSAPSVDDTENMDNDDMPF